VWEGKVDEHLKDIYTKYKNEFGCAPDSYARIYYDLMTYDEFCGYIEECLEKHVSIPHVVK